MPSGQKSLNWCFVTANQVQDKFLKPLFDKRATLNSFLNITSMLAGNIPTISAKVFIKFS